MTRAIGRSLELYYIDGRPDGMLTAELFNWTGHVLMTPRTQIAEALARPEASYAGVYLLIGEQEGEPRAYVGEGEDISARIRSHDVRKEWWTSAVLITAAANKLNKAHVRYLEARLIAEARAIGRVPLDNGTNPTLAALSEADVAKMEAFLENLFIVLPAVRVDMFIRRARPTAAKTQPDAAPAVETSTDAPEAKRFVLENRRHDIHATAVLRDGEFIVEAGSTARGSWAGLAHHNYVGLYSELIRSGVLAPQGNHCVFTESYAFSSPSAAATVVFGRAASGPQSWRLEGSEMTYKEWEAARIEDTFEDLLGASE
ncbi:GIY-YIG nuclease family protein [Sphingomonas glacialis]|uniref:GIY-YIG nuclease family protein n=1 Tax=Sphingomonas glacialis TaxID=658225 RepID=A0A502FZG2_9SPHN|nr:GIY-YIG nuclease family protein [Sphingomonas glacialis]TPG55037.1 GIY-YIG nuclease family protein [Sphingomonas glacialis]